MKIKDRPEFRTKADPLTFLPSEMVSSAAAAMTARNYGSVIVVDSEQRVLGLVTERDILRRLVHKGMDPKTTPLEAIMTRDVKVARAEDDLLDWLRIMSNERFRRLPIIDAEGRVISIMTQGDFVSYTWPELFYQASQLSKATISRNYQIILIAGGILLYFLLVIALINMSGLFNWL